ncbi:MAG: tRNA (adenosine(37)-N6)-threonylcarbamoyltransferase complex transferase subunit TsaD [Victivallales bacterium]|nr:tRNA (adenosine(37)-N6)-threonylcarbamoyltransferase complex transferase subunit TsaD [Victivallales bacterium]
MKILGIESSCDETAAAIVEDGHKVMSSVISSQVELHAGYGGVIPELAAREHLKNINPIVTEALLRANLTLDDVDAIAVTSNPGLIPALLVGNAYAKGLASARNLPIIGINHFLAHIYGAFIEHPELIQDTANFPLLALVVSGGHTAIVLIPEDGKARIVGSTLDDAAGEALDKAAKILYLGYPGGPVIDKLSKNANEKAFNFPRSLTGAAGKPVAEEHVFDFSFSGVKTSLLNTVNKTNITDDILPDVVASFQAAVMDVLVSKAIHAAKHFRTPLIALCGGVACNSSLREKLSREAAKCHKAIALAPPKYCTDNAAMVAGLAYHYYKHGHVDSIDMPANARLNHDLGVIPFAPKAQ